MKWGRCNISGEKGGRVKKAREKGKLMDQLLRSGRQGPCTEGSLKKRCDSSVETGGGGDRKHMRNLKLENKNQKAVHIRHIKTSKLEVRSFTTSSRIMAQGWELGDCGNGLEEPQWGPR